MPGATVPAAWATHGAAGGPAPAVHRGPVQRPTKTYELRATRVAVANLLKPGQPSPRSRPFVGAGVRGALRALLAVDVAPWQPRPGAAAEASLARPAAPDASRSGVR